MFVDVDDIDTLTINGNITLSATNKPNRNFVQTTTLAGVVGIDSGIQMTNVDVVMNLTLNATHWGTVSGICGNLYKYQFVYVTNVTFEGNITAHN